MNKLAVPGTPGTPATNGTTLTSLRDAALAGHTNMSGLFAALEQSNESEVLRPCSRCPCCRC